MERNDVIQGGAGSKTRRNKSSSHWTLLVLFTSLVLDLLAFTVILPLIPSILEFYGRNDKVCSYRASLRASDFVTEMTSSL